MRRREKASTWRSWSTEGMDSAVHLVEGAWCGWGAACVGSGVHLEELVDGGQLEVGEHAGGERGGRACATHGAPDQQGTAWECTRCGPGVVPAKKGKEMPTTESAEPSAGPTT